MENKTKKSDKFNGFIEGKGFYITLAVCLCIIGASGYVLFFAPSSEPVYEVEVPSNITTTASLPAGANIPDVKVKIEEPTTQQKETEATADIEKPVSKPTPIAVAEKIYLPPVVGKVAKSFSNGELIYDKTMGDYRTHNGVDIICENGTQVTCFADGKVEKVFANELYGSCVVINHGDGVKSVYKGLDKGITLKEGSKISVGDVIGAAANTNITEAEEEPHIHFEVLKDGKYVDPLAMINQE